jgi:iron complex outermembrane receptor protein
VLRRTRRTQTGTPLADMSYMDWKRAIAVAAAAQALCAQDRDLTSLSLEEFLNVEVTSVDKSRQKLSKSPAAVFVITAEDIRRSGASSLPEVLRLAPGVHVARIASSEWAISIRGFSSIYSNKLLVMVDGRPVYNALLSGTLWDENMVMLDDVERIEVIRGPGATMWGANAVSGVINVITKDSRATQGGLAAVTGGTFDRSVARFRYGGAAGDNGAWRGWVQHGMFGQTTFPEPIGTIAPWRNIRGGGRFDWQIRPGDSLLLEGEAISTRAPTPFALSGDVLNTSTDGGYVMGRWTHTTQRGDEAEIQASLNDETLDASLFSGRIRTLDFNLQHKIHLPRRHLLLVGGGGRSNVIETAGTPNFSFDPANRTYRILNGFVQDEWELRPDQLTVTAGVKVEHYTLAGNSVQPTARLMWTPNHRQGYWLSVSRALRTPAHTDYAIRAPLSLPGAPLPLELMGSDQFQPEVLNAVEVGTRFKVSRSWAFDLTGFQHRYSRLHSYRVQVSLPGFPLPSAGLAGPAPPVIPALTVNGLDGLNRGVEAVVYYDVRPAWQITASYSSLFADTSFRSGFSSIDTFAFDSYTPKHQWQVHSYWRISRNWTFDAALYRVGALPGGALAGHSRVDCRFGRRFGEFGEVFVSGQNLLRPYQREFAGNLLYNPGLVRRSIDAGIRWSF